MQKVLNYDDITASLSIEVNDRYGKRVIEGNFKMFNKDIFLLEFTSKAESGQKILKDGKNYYMAYPSGDVLKIKERDARQSVAGSSASFDDLFFNGNLEKEFNFNLANDKVKFKGKSVDVFKIMAEAKHPKDKPFPKNVFYITKDSFQPLRVEKYTRNGKLAQVLITQDIQKISGKNFVTVARIEDRAKKGNFSIMKYSNVKIGAGLTKVEIVSSVKH